MELGRENETREFKQSLSQLDKGIKSLTAMLNRSHSGTVYFGVMDDGRVCGLTIGDKTLTDIRNRVRELVEPQIVANIREHTDETGKQYIALSAMGTDIPYSCDGRYYIRNVAADESVSNDLLRKMLASGDADIIRHMPSENQELTFRRLFAILSANGVHVSDSETFYLNYGLLNRDRRFSFMAYLLSDQNQISIKIVRFAGSTKASMSERTEYGAQCLLATVQAVLEYAKSLNTTRVSLVEGVRTEEALFPFESFREAWINACLHNSWHEKIPPAVYLYDDRIEIVSYGGLPYNLSLDGFFKGTSIPVNKSLLNLFIIAGFAEQSRHGVPIIVTECGTSAFSFDDGMLKVTLKYRFEPDSVIARQARDRRLAKITANQQRVMDYFTAHPDATLTETAAALDISLGGVKKIVARLQSLDLLHREGSKRKGRWQTVD